MSKELKRLLNRLSKNAQISLSYSRYVADRLNSPEIAPIHVFIGILLNQDSLANRVLVSMGINRDDSIRALAGEIVFDIAPINQSFEGVFTFSFDTREVLQAAFALANKFAHVYVGTEHILMAILTDNRNDVAKKLKDIGLKPELFKETLMNAAIYPPGILSQPDNQSTNDSQSENLLPMLGHDLVQEAKEGAFDPLVGREKELRQIINILSRRRKNNPIIVGEAGVGKTALVEGLAQAIADNNVPTSLQNMRLIELDIPAIMAGSKLRGDVEEKMLAIISEVVNSTDVILFIDEVHNILGSNLPGVGLDIAAVLKPALVRDDFRVIGATTSDEYTKYFEDDNALVRRFQPILLEEPTVDETVEILHRVEPLLEKHHNVDITDEAIEVAAKLSDRYVVDRFLPDKAIDLLDEAAASKKLDLELKFSEVAVIDRKLNLAFTRKEKAILDGDMALANKWAQKEKKLEDELKQFEQKRTRSRRAKKYVVDVEAVYEVVSKWTGIPISTVSSKESELLLGLSKSLSKSVVGQDDAVKVVANAVKRARAGISDADRPWASLLFLGPTGVGKTELAKALTKSLFGDEDRLIQIDMSEMMEMHSISKLVGSPPGYVGYREGGQLTEMVRKRPHSVILFDEIEKAHPDVLNVLLQIMEYGHLTDGRGRKVNFKNTIVILTSNIGAEEISKDRVLGFSAVEKVDYFSSKSTDVDGAYDAMRTDLIKALKLKLRPELINRLDEVVIFRSLSPVDAKSIVKLLIGELNLRLKDRGVFVELTPSALELLVSEGFSPDYGARPLRRVIQSKIESLIADFLLAKRPTIETSGELVAINVGVGKANEFVIK